MHTCGLLQDFSRVFEDDFEFWEEEHFTLIPSSVITLLRDTLLKGNVNLMKRIGRKIFKFLLTYIEEARYRANKTKKSESSIQATIQEVI